MDTSSSGPGQGDRTDQTGQTSLPGMDLRGVNLEGARLAGTDLRDIRTGLTPRSKVLLISAALIASIALGVVTGLGARRLLTLIDSGDPRKVALALHASAGLFVFLVAAMWKGGATATRVVLPVVAAMYVASALIAIATGVGTGAGAIAVLGFLVVAAAIIALAALARAVAGTVSKVLFAIVAITGGLAGGFVGGGIPAAVVAIAAMLIGRKALAGNASYPMLTRASVALACKRGTRFRGADLSGADLTGVEFEACDFRQARLTGARMEGTAFRACLFDGNQATPPPDREAPRQV